MVSYRNHCKNERCFLTCLYRSPSQNREQFQSFCNSLLFSLKWYSFETRDNIGNELNIITSNAWYTQIIDKPNNFTNHSYSCIDLSFTSNPSIIEDSGIEKPLTINVHFLKL